ncbi:hypothetical protein D3C86_1386850 [compost metagenome]
MTAMSRIAATRSPIRFMCWRATARRRSTISDITRIRRSPISRRRLPRHRLPPPFRFTAIRPVRRPCSALRSIWQAAPPMSASHAPIMARPCVMVRRHWRLRPKAVRFRPSCRSLPVPWPRNGKRSPIPAPRNRHGCCLPPALSKARTRISVSM